MMTIMRGRMWIWVGATVTMAALTGLAVHLAWVGLDDADKLASVLSLFVGVAGLGVTIYGLVTDRKSGNGGHEAPSPQDRPNVTASGERSIAIGGDNTGIVSTGDDTTNTQLR
ncbi:hypothetical protein AB0K60_22205 [Thermopolyspora sp. NPDC052614]|uniref:hypothetical protein n=1 Tax=Thermopolyspora sp. NPDC052614 TaxID=3155682 RepID=UPI00344781EE